MSITQEQISRLQKLTALNNKKDINIDMVIESFDVLSKVETSSQESITRSGNDHLNLREDTVVASDFQGELLTCSPQRVAADQIILKGIMQGE